MSNLENNQIDDDMKFVKFESSAFPEELFQRQFPPFQPQPKSQPGAPFPNPSNFPSPGIPLNSSGVPSVAPPNYTPSKNDQGVKSLTNASGNINTKAVSEGSIKFCLYKFTYIWETGGRSYWAFLINVDKQTASGFRWFRGRWVYFGTDLKRIDSFVCPETPWGYNRSEEEANNQDNSSSTVNTKKEFTIDEEKDIYTQTIDSFNVSSEEYEQFLTPINRHEESITPVTATYKVNLELSYPSKYNNITKEKINLLADESIDYACRVLASTRSNYFGEDTPNLTDDSIPQLLKIFSSSFNSKLYELDPSLKNFRDISYCIRKELI